MPPILLHLETDFLHPLAKRVFVCIQFLLILVQYHAVAKTNVFLQSYIEALGSEWVMN